MVRKALCSLLFLSHSMDQDPIVQPFTTINRFSCRKNELCLALATILCGNLSSLARRLSTFDSCVKSTISPVAIPRFALKYYYFWVLFATTPLDHPLYKLLTLFRTSFSSNSSQQCTICQNGCRHSNYYQKCMNKLQV